MVKTTETITTTTTKTRIVITPQASPVKKESSLKKSDTPSHFGNVLPHTPLIHSIPRPEELPRPRDGEVPDGYYIVTMGRQCGIFFYWCASLFFT